MRSRQSMFFVSFLDNSLFLVEEKEEEEEEVTPREKRKKRTKKTTTNSAKLFNSLLSLDALASGG